MVKFYLFLSLVIVNIIYGLFYATRKKNIQFVFTNSSISFSLDQILFLVLILDLIYVASTSTAIADYSVYRDAYYSGDLHSFEYGYTSLMSIGRKLNLTFDMFRTYIFCVCIFLISFSFKKFDKYKNISLGLYSIFPFTFDVIQIRNFIAVSIVIFAIQFLLKDGIKNLFLYIFLVLLATSFHTISVFYLIFILIKFRHKKKIRDRVLKCLLFLSIVTSIFVKISPSFMNVLIAIFISVNSNKALSYTTNSINYGFLLYWLMEIIYLLCSYILVKSENFDENENRIKDLIFWINVCISCYFPLLLINIDFYRIYRNISLLNYIQLPILLGSSMKKNKRLGMVVFITAYIINVLINLSNPNEVFYPIFGLK